MRKQTLRLLAASTLLATVSTHAGQWQYVDEADKMTGKGQHRATLESDNSLSFSSPYAGKNYGNIMVRKHPQYGLDVMVGIEKGQILCHSYDPCLISVKFDNRPPIKFRGTPPADHSSTIVFLSPEAKFISEASKAKTILVQLNVFKQGNPVLEFSSPTPLAWKPGK